MSRIWRGNLFEKKTPIFDASPSRYKTVKFFPPPDDNDLGKKEVPSVL